VLLCPEGLERSGHSPLPHLINSVINAALVSAAMLLRLKTGERSEGWVKALKVIFIRASLNRKTALKCCNALRITIVLIRAVTPYYSQLRC